LTRATSHPGSNRRSRPGKAPGSHRRRAFSAPANRRLAKLRRLGRIVLGCIGVFVIGSIVMVAVYRALPPPATPLMLLRLVDGHGIHKRWRSLAHIFPHLVRAVIAGEDAQFCRHRGFDWNAIETDWDRYERGGGRLLGASTISMQTAKNVFLWPGRDWPRKTLEAYFTVLIELAWGKRRIMEIYLNVVEWGPGIYGAEAAARHYFDEPASVLTESEAVRLAAVLPDPLDWSPRRPSRHVVARSAWIESNMSALPTAQPLPCGVR
jgi:monofunctional glycosyltransferase